MNEKKDSLRWMIIIVAAIAIIGIAGLFWWKSVAVIPNIVIPSPKMPNPNAFDYFNKAVGLMVDEKKISEAFQKTAKSSAAKPMTIADKEALLKRNAAALAMLRQGFDYDYRNPPIRSHYITVPYMPKFRNIARLVVLEGQVRTSRGDWNGAASCYIDAMSFGNKIQRGGNIIHGLLGVAVESIARANLWDTINQLNADEAKVVITRIEEIEASRAPFADILQEEKWSMTASIIEMFKAPNQRRQFSSTSTSLIKSLIMQPARSIKTYTRYMDDCIAEARKPYILRRDVVVPDEPITQAFGSVRKQGHFVFTYRQYTLDSLLKTMLALHAYKLEHNKYPKSLSELVPGYLKKLPDDPFAAYKPLQYKQAGKKYLLYSIGPDGKDNGGKPVFHLSKSDPSERFSAQHDSRGDIVAGVNTIR